VILSGRHHVTLDESRRLRPHKVVRAEATVTELGVRMRYETISRHWTWRGAQKVARRLNKKDGFA